MTLNKITALIQRLDKKGIVDVYADGEYLMSVSEDAAIEAGLRVGLQINEDFLSQVEHSVQLSKAKNKAYNYLSYGDMSRKKLFEKLSRYGFDQQICNECVDAMCRSGYIDDMRYACSLAASLATGRLYGPRRIIQELRQRGVDPQTASEALDSLETDFRENIKTLISGRLRRDMSDPKEIKKLISALMRNGYDYDAIKSVLSETAYEEEIYE